MVSACQASSCVRIIQPKPSSQLAVVLMARLLSLKRWRCGLDCRYAAHIPSFRSFPTPSVVSITFKGTRLAIPVNLSVSDPLSKKKKRSFTRVTQRRFFLFLLFLFLFLQCNNLCNNLVRHLIPVVYPLEPFVRQRFPKVSASGFFTAGNTFRPAGRHMLPPQCQSPLTRQKHDRVT